MELKVKKETLSQAISTSLKAVAVKATVPIMECILFTVENDEVRLTSNDGEIGIDTFMNAEIKENGSLCVDAKTLSAIVGKFPNGDVTIKTDDTTMTIKCGRSKFNIAIKDGSEFPVVDMISRDNHLVLDQSILKDTIRQTVFSASLNDNNKMMTGVLFDISDKLKVIALDGHRIAIREIDLDTENEPTKLIIPSKTLQEISKLLSSGDVEIYFTNNQIAFNFDATVVVSRLIEGNFFDVNKMITDEHSTEITIDRQELYDSMDRATLLVKEIERKPVLMKIGETLKVEIATQLGSMDEEVEAKIEGEPIEVIGLNPRFILDVLKVLDEDKITMWFSGATKPCYIRGDGYNYLILPIKV